MSPKPTFSLQGFNTWTGIKTSHYQLSIQSRLWNDVATQIIPKRIVVQFDLNYINLFIVFIFLVFKARAPDKRGI